MARIRVLVVDDSVVVRRLVSDVLAEDPRVEVVGTAPNGKVALAKIEQVSPDLVTLDVEMPVMGGLETLEHLRRRYPDLPVIMFSTVTARGATATLDALERGARDYVTKPANVGSISDSMAAVRSELVPRILALCPSLAVPPPPRQVAPVRTLLRPQRQSAPAEVVVVGVSTGGPEAVTTLLTALPASLPVPVVVVQHMPAVFTRQFADRLDARCALRVKEAAAGDVLTPGRVIIARGDHHLRVVNVRGIPEVSLDQGTPENYCRPAVDVLFRTAAQVYGAGVLALVMTGMGADGARGSGEVVQAGGRVLVQDEATSVVWGMPGAVVAAGHASEVLPLSDLAGAVVRRTAPARDDVLPGPRSGKPSLPAWATARSTG